MRFAAFEGENHGDCSTNAQFWLKHCRRDIEKWLKREGAFIEKGELLVVIMTEKVSVEIPAEVSGRY